MHSFNLSNTMRGFIMLSCALFLMSCNSQFASSMRKVTYPPDFKYTEPNELRTDMARLALQMQFLDKALAEAPGQSSTAGEQQREDVLTALRNISAIATNLEAGQSGANHPFMQDYMTDFVAKVYQAKSAASLAQPNYYFAGKVSGGCAGCHKINR
jgi:hypothetical protein